MLQSNDYQLHHVKQEISRQVSFPEEMSVAIDETAARELLDEIRSCESDDDLTTLTFGLSRRRLNDLFGAVLVISAADGEIAINRLLDIFRKRATNSLAQTAWAFYQRHYPNDRLGRVLMTLMRSLETKDEKKEEKHIFLDELKSLPIDKQLPLRLAEQLRRQPDNMQKARRAVTGLDKAIAGKTTVETVPAGSDAMPLSKIQEKYPLLAAYTSLTSIPDQPTRQNCLSSGLCSYMIRLSIMPDTSFTAAFLHAYFLATSDQDILINADLFLQALQLGSITVRLALLRRYLRDYRMSESWNGLNEAILDAFGAPPDVLASGTSDGAAAGSLAHAPAGSSVPVTTENQRQTVNAIPGSLIDSASDRSRLSPQASYSGKQPLNADTSNYSAGADSRVQPAGTESIPSQSVNTDASEQKSKGIMGWLRGRKNKVDNNEQSQDKPEHPAVTSASTSVSEPTSASLTMQKSSPVSLSSSVQPVSGGTMAQSASSPTELPQTDVFGSKPTRRYAKLGEPDNVQPVGGFKAFDFDQLLKAGPAPAPTQTAEAGAPVIPASPVAPVAAATSMHAATVEPVKPSASAANIAENPRIPVADPNMDLIPKRQTSQESSEAAAVISPAVTEPVQPPSPETAKALAEIQQALLAGLGNNSVESSETAVQTADLPGDRSVWEMLERPVVDRFRQWEFMHQITLHNPGNRRKLLFYQRYSLEIRRIVRWDSKALIVHFANFIIADYTEEEDQVWYYDLNTYQMLSEHKFHRPALNKPEQAVMSSRMAMLSESKSNIVRLQLDAINLLYSHDFLNNLKNAEKGAGKKNGDSII